MPITAEHAGRTYPPTTPYHVTPAKIAEFAAALGQQPTPTAPPTFAAVVMAKAWEQLFTDPELDIALKRVMHTDQRFTWHRPLRAGDQVSAALTITNVRVRGTTEIIGAAVDIAVSGETACRCESTFWHTREA